MLDRDSFLRTIYAHPTEEVPRRVFADWLEDQGQYWEAKWYRQGPISEVIKTGFFLEYLRRGSGDGTVNHDGTGEYVESELGFQGGNGYCLAYSIDDKEEYLFGDSIHNGYEEMWDKGAGYEYDGNRIDYEDGDFQFTQLFQVTPMLELGSQVLVILPHGFVVCGIVGEQKGVAAWQMHNVSMICRTNGVPWDELADGQQQDKPTYRKWGDVIVHNPIMVREWKGQLP